MRRALLVLGLILSTGAPARAHTYSEREITCPICRGRFKVRETMSMTTFGAYLDFQKKGAIGSYYEDLVVLCPVCHFAGYKADFEKKVGAELRKRVLAELRPRRGPFSEAQECEVAAQIYEWSGRKPQETADHYLVASYLLRGKKGALETERRRYQQLAASRYAIAFEKKTLEEKERAPVAYLVGELHRRSGKFDEALRWYKLALKEKAPPAWLAKQIAEQQKLARKRDAQNGI